MAAVGTTKTQFDGSKRLVVQTILMPTEAAGEFTFTIDVSALNNQRFPTVANGNAAAIPCVSLSLQKIWYSVSVAAKEDSVSIVGDATAQGSGTYTFYRNASDVPGGGEPPQATTVPTANVYGITDILNVGFRQNYNTTSQSDITLTKVDRSAYSGTANKATVGTPSQFWVQRFIDRVTVTIYPLPNATAAAATSKLMVYYVKRIQDVGAFSNATDTPFRFVPCMVSGLSYLLSQKFAPERTQELKLFYEDDLARALSEDGSPSSTYITPKTYYPNI